MHSNTPLISIIIPTKNSATTLEDCLVSIKNQTYEHLEIIVVDNFSSDSTWEITRKYTQKFFQKGPERTTQKNYWIEQSKGEYIAFIDSDMILESWVIAECIALFESTPNSLWGICIREKSIGEWLFVKIRDFERSFYDSTIVSSARFFRKSDVVSVWGFEEDIIFFEESLLPQKIEKILRLDCKRGTESVIFHQEWNVTLADWLRKKYYYGKSIEAYWILVRERWIENTWKSQMNILLRYMIFLKERRFYTRPILALWVFFLKTLEFSAGWLWFIVWKYK